jgi:hypothetical protein
MAFPLSPDVNVSEFNLTTIVPQVSTSTAAIAGIFRWGPVNQPVLVSKQNDIVTNFLPPNNSNPETWFTSSNFLDYGSSLFITRVANTTNATAGVGTLSAFANSSAAPSSNLSLTVTNLTAYLNTASFDSNVQWIAKYPGAAGNSLRISVCDSVNAYSSNVSLVQVSNTVCNGTFTAVVGSNALSFVFNNDVNGNTYASAVAANLSVGDSLTLGNSSIGIQNIKIANISTVTAGAFTVGLQSNFNLSTNYVANTTVNGNTSVVNLQRTWEFASAVGSAPNTSYWVSKFGNTAAVDSIHAVVVDAGGVFTGVANTILEVYKNLSRATDAQSTNGQTIYYKTVINNNSKYVWFANDRTGAVSNTSNVITSSTNNSAYNQTFVAGQDGYTESTAPLSILATGYNFYADKQTFDVSFILQGKPTAGSTTVNGQTVSNFGLANYLIGNIAEVRKDCIVFISPDQNIITQNPGAEALSLVNWDGSLQNSTYAVMDSGYKYTYDKYNDVYRYIPLNGDIAGLCARTDVSNDPWVSPAGFTRGQIKNVIKLRWNPSKTDRDIIYPQGINPVVTFPGQGTFLFGDATSSNQPSAFNRINVRRLFIVLEKAIARYAKYSLFEFNDSFTRAQFRNTIIPYLRDVQSRRGITDFVVVCDTTNNTGQIIDSNQFVGDIYIKPNRSINFIQLNFVAVGTGVDFSTVVGGF